MTALCFTGTRRAGLHRSRPHTGRAYYVDPGAIGGSVVEANPEDAKALVERDPALWEYAKSIAPVEAAPVDDEPTPRGGKGKKE